MSNVVFIKYYHRKNPENDLREKKQDYSIKESGYDVLHINENDYNKNKSETIKTCINFLTNGKFKKNNKDN